MAATCWKTHPPDTRKNTSSQQGVAFHWKMFADTGPSFSFKMVFLLFRFSVSACTPRVPPHLLRAIWSPRSWWPMRARAGPGVQVFCFAPRDETTRAARPAGILFDLKEDSCEFVGTRHTECVFCFFFWFAPGVFGVLHETSRGPPVSQS